MPVDPGQPPEHIVVVRDVHLRVAAEQRLKGGARHATACWRSITPTWCSSSISIFVRRYVSPACREILGYEPEELLGGETCRLGSFR